LFESRRAAKEYLIGRIVDEAGREGVLLSETECKMMYFSETAWTLSDMTEVEEVFDRECDSSAYEAKVGSVARKARAQAVKSGERERWNEALKVLSDEDHYLLVLIGSGGTSSDALWVDRLKLVGTALMVCLLLLAGVFLFSLRK
jgi:hypothetical protein